MIYYFTVSLGGPATLAREFPWAFDTSPHAALVDRERGPDGLAGTVLYADAVVQLPTIEWRRCGAGWVGWNPVHRPGPAALERRMVPKVGWPRVMLADGNEWAIPTAVPCRDRDPARESQLPAKAMQADGGALRWELLPESAALAARVSRVLDGPMDTDAVIRLATDLLAVGYRVSLAEVLALDLITRDGAIGIVQAAIDWHERVAAIECVDDRARRGVDLLAEASGTDRGDIARLVALL